MAPSILTRFKAQSTLPQFVAQSTLPHFKARLPLPRCYICDKFRKYVPLSDLRECVEETDCPRCGIIWHGAKRLYNHVPSTFVIDSLLRRNGIIDVYETKDEILYINPREMRAERDVSHDTGFEIFTLFGTQKCSLPWVGVRRLTPDRLSNEYVPILLNWIEECTREHACAPLQGPLPARILDLGTGNSEMIRLRETQMESGRYIAFSHCWGKTGSTEFCTTRVNFHDRLRGFSSRDLPKSYREVISIARNIGVQFVCWDRCPSYNSAGQEDWEVQSGDMAAVYNNAFLVVGASCAEDSTKGFIASSSYKNSMQIGTVENHDGSVSEIYVQPIQKHGRLCDPFAYETARRPFASRGWTLQEQILLCGMVHFEQQEMIWECRNNMECECGELDSSTIDDYKTAMESEICQGSYKTWHTIVNEYHTRSLTHASDFLPALSGIVTHMRRSGAGEFLAGLWVTRLHEQMLWCTKQHPDKPVFCRAQPYRAPTWSWASLDRSIKKRDVDKILFVDGYAEDENYVTLCQILHAHCTPTGPDMNGAVSDGELKINGTLIPINYTKHSWGGYHTLSLHDISPLPWLEDDPSLPRHILLDTSEQHVDTKLYALVFGYRVITFSKPGTFVFAGLVLCASKKDNDVFERAGYWAWGARIKSPNGSSETERRQVATAVETEVASATRRSVVIH